MIRLSSVCFGVAEEEAALQVLRSGRLVQGPRVQEFEQAMCARLGAVHAIAVSSGTAALHLSLWALGIGPGDRVIVPSLTFPAPANVVSALGAEPIFADVEPDTWNVSARTVAAAMDTGIKAVVVVDQFGVPADVAAIAAIAGVPVVEDAACALGSSLRGRPCGVLGPLGTLSFHPRKVLTTGEGGMVLCTEPAMAERITALRNHGMSTTPPYAVAGLNYRMPEVCAAIGSVQLERLEELLAGRRQIAAFYREALGLTFQSAPVQAIVNEQTFGVLLPTGSGLERRDRAISMLRARGVEAQILSFANHLLPLHSGRGQKAPEAEDVAARGIALPIHAAMSFADARTVADELAKVLREVVP